MKRNFFSFSAMPKSLPSTFQVFIINGFLSEFWETVRHAFVRQSSLTIENPLIVFSKWFKNEKIINEIIALFTWTFCCCCIFGNICCCVCCLFVVIQRCCRCFSLLSLCLLLFFFLCLFLLLFVSVFVFAVFVVVAVVSVVVIVIVIVVVVVVNKLQSRKELSLPVAHGCGCRRSQISHLVQPHYF